MTTEFKKVAAIRGMNDVLPDASHAWEAIEEILRQWLKQYGYLNMRSPVLEHTRLFTRGIGEVTDIVEKEMYTFVDSLNGESLTLRPEFTAGLVRATIEHNLLYDRPRRIYSMGPVFRHERPQRGRYRQFHQLDVEALGFAGPDVDAELILMTARLWALLGIDGIELAGVIQAIERAIGGAYVYAAQARNAAEFHVGSNGEGLCVDVQQLAVCAQRQQVIGIGGGATQGCGGDGDTEQFLGNVHERPLYG